jgi:2-succinyl-5-enolpyruvyl-6-hydroxy-3-cyclohexene-1-carboxylate synthase
VIAVPIALSARWLTLANRGLQGVVGLVTVAIGINTIVATAFG